MAIQANRFYFPFRYVEWAPQDSKCRFSGSKAASRLVREFPIKTARSQFKKISGWPGLGGFVIRLTRIGRGPYNEVDCPSWTAPGLNEPYGTHAISGLVAVPVA